jgi:hypothetical protein
MCIVLPTTCHFFVHDSPTNLTRSIHFGTPIIVKTATDQTYPNTGYGRYMSLAVGAGHLPHLRNSRQRTRMQGVDPRSTASQREIYSWLRGLTSGLHGQARGPAVDESDVWLDGARQHAAARELVG